MFQPVAGERVCPTHPFSSSQTVACYASAVAIKDGGVLVGAAGKWVEAQGGTRSREMQLQK